MAYFDTEGAIFNEKLLMIETTDPIHADVMNSFTAAHSQ